MSRSHVPSSMRPARNAAVTLLRLTPSRRTSHGVSTKMTLGVSGDDPKVAHHHCGFVIQNLDRCLFNGIKNILPKAARIRIGVESHLYNECFRQSVLF